MQSTGTCYARVIKAEVMASNGGLFFIDRGGAGQPAHLPRSGLTRP